MLVPGLGNLPVFECISSPDPKLNKRPATKHGFHDARLIEPSARWGLCGVRAGDGSIDCLDIDPAKGGDRWYRENFDALPLTRAHESQRRGVHLLFKHAPGLRKSTSKIAPGIDVLADGGYFIWWPREGLPFEDHALSEWPDWLLAEAMAGQHQHPPVGEEIECRRAPLSSDFNTSVNPPFHVDLTQIDPTKYQDLSDWLALMTSCKVAGVEREAFVAWSVSDPDYADHAESVRGVWDRLRPNGAITEATLFRALRGNREEPGDKLIVPPRWRRLITPRDSARMMSITDVIARANSVKDAEDKLYWAGCRYGAIRMEIVITDAVLEQLLLGAGWHWGLRDKRRMRRQINNGLRDGALDWLTSHHMGARNSCRRAPSLTDIKLNSTEEPNE
jgi:hypothetical protein